MGDLGKAILAGAPPEAQAQLAPFIPEIVAAIHRAFSLAVASTFAFGIAAAVVAVAVVLFLREERQPAQRPATTTFDTRRPSRLAESGK